MRFHWLVGGAVFLLALGGCGDEGGSATSPSTTTSSTVPEPQVPSPAELEALVVGLPAPFEQQSDDVIDTGLMEPGNPDAGTIGIGYADESDLVAAGFLRGWEKYFHDGDDAAMVGHVFFFDGEAGPLAMVERFSALEEPGFEEIELAGAPGAVAFAGTSPEGRSAYVAAAAHGRFLIGFTLGGPPGAHDYEALLVDLVQRQHASLPDD